MGKILSKLGWLALVILWIGITYFPRHENNENIVEASNIVQPPTSINGVPLSSSLSLSTLPLTQTYVAGAGGTTAGLLVTLDASGNVITAATNSTTVIGVAMSTVVATASVEVAISGLVTCISDSNFTGQNMVIPGTTTAGRCHDSGTTVYSSVGSTLQIIGKAVNLAAGGGNLTLLLTPNGFGLGGLNGITAASIPFGGATTGTLSQDNANFNYASATHILTVLRGIKGAGNISTGTKFTTTGCSVSATTGGATAGTYTSGTTGTCTVVITMNGATGLTSPTGWACSANDQTTPADKQNQSASNTTTATISGTTVSGDVISFGCIGY